MQIKIPYLSIVFGILYVPSISSGEISNPVKKKALFPESIHTIKAIGINESRMNTVNKRSINRAIQGNTGPSYPQQPEKNDAVNIAYNNEGRPDKNRFHYKIKPLKLPVLPVESLRFFQAINPASYYPHLTINHHRQQPGRFGNKQRNIDNHREHQITTTTALRINGLRQNYINRNNVKSLACGLHYDFDISLR